jgi:phosphohistidine phosphatase
MNGGQAMKRLLILRHAKAQPDAPAGDHPRHLTTRGRRDAAAIGAHINQTIGRPDEIVSSDAVRARQTAELVAEATGYSAPLTLEPGIYGAGVDSLLQAVRTRPDTAETVVLVGHNPGLEELVAALAPTDDPVELPTAGLAQIEFDLPRWREIRPGSGLRRGLTTPKMLA